MNRLSSGGLNALEAFPEVKTRTANLIEQCQTARLFLVPVGELEWWVTELMRNFSQVRKAAWANEAARRIRDHQGDVWDFLRGFVESGFGWSSHAHQASRSRLSVVNTVVK
jgi:hypothetical protein